MTWWQIALIVYGLGVVGVWAFIGHAMTRPGAQSQHGGELIGCLAAFLWPIAAPFALWGWLRGGF